MMGSYHVFLMLFRPMLEGCLFYRIYSISIMSWIVTWAAMDRWATPRCFRLIVSDFVKFCQILSDFVEFFISPPS